MRKDLADLTVIMDRSGSMQNMKDDAEGGINSLVEEQQNMEGECNFTLVKFDDQIEFDYKGEDIQNIEKVKLHPRNQTALFDAIVHAINNIQERLDNMDDNEKPALVLVAVVTDGMENASKETKHKQTIRDLISEKEDQGWKFTYVGANQDGFAEGQSLGFSGHASATYSAGSAHKAFSSMSRKTGQMRSMMNFAPDNDVELKATLNNASYEYDEKDREDMLDDKDGQ